MTTSVPPNAIVRWLAANRVRETGVARTGSARADVSSLRSRSADWIAKPAAIEREDAERHREVLLDERAVALRGDDVGERLVVLDEVVDASR